MIRVSADKMGLEPDSGTRVHVSDSVAADVHLAQVSHMAIGAHPDDLEIIGIQGIHQSIGSSNQFFGGVVVTNGAGSTRGSEYKNLSDSEFAAERSAEQLAAAEFGGYEVLVELRRNSSELLDGLNSAIVDRLVALIDTLRPDTLYIHNPFDRHATHAALSMHCLQALREVSDPPETVYGVEVWRNLDWVSTEYRVTLDVSACLDLQASLLSLFKSQVSENKRYDVALVDRSRSHATLLDERSVDQLNAGLLAVDLSHLVGPDAESSMEYIAEVLDRFSLDVNFLVQGFSKPSP